MQHNSIGILLLSFSHYSQNFKTLQSRKEAQITPNEIMYIAKKHTQMEDWRITKKLLRIHHWNHEKHLKSTKPFLRIKKKTTQKWKLSKKTKPLLLFTSISVRYVCYLNISNLKVDKKISSTAVKSHIVHVWILLFTLYFKSFFVK